jgi:hypothetical protein
LEFLLLRTGYGLKYRQREVTVDRKHGKEYVSGHVETSETGWPAVADHEETGESFVRWRGGEEIGMHGGVIIISL